MKKLLLLIFIVSCLCVVACKNDPKENNKSTIATPSNVLPNTPALVVREWQKNVDNNQFEAAKTLSTDRMKGYIERVLMKIMAADASVIHTDLGNLECVIAADSTSAVCTYSTTMIDTIVRPPYPKGTELVGGVHILKNSFEDHFKVVRENGQWLVDNEKDEELQNILNGK